MSERKVLNKYYPPDYDASKIPRVKREKNRQFTIRLMVPFNIRCKTCGEYIYRGKKFNARKEDVIGKLYLGIQIYRFYIKCTKCLAEITFLTDPENQDYAMENGAIRNFESLRLAEKQAENEAIQAKEEEENNPMKVLENRTRDSRREMDVLETLEDLRERNAANFAGVDPKVLLEAEEEYKKQLVLLEKQEDEEEIKRIFSQKYSEEDKEVSNTLKQSSGKTKIHSNSNQEGSESKKLKTEPVEPSDHKETKPGVLFKKSIIESSSTQPLVGQLKKNNVSSFIKKKPIEIKSEPNETNVSQSLEASTSEQAKPTSSLLSLMSSYGCSDDDDDDSS